MKRRLFNLAAAVSLVLCVATVVLWLNARRGVAALEVRTRAGRYWQFSSTMDGLGVFQATRWPESAGVARIGYLFAQGPADRTLPVFMWADVRVARLPAVAELARGGVCVALGPDATVLRIPPAPPGPPGPGLSSPLPFWKLKVSHAMLIGAFSLLPFLLLLRHAREWHRKRMGHCPTCGYDLRATPQGGRCPECGVAATTEATTA